MQSANAVLLDELTSETGQLAATFEQVLATGHAVVSETTSVSADQNTRRGEIILGLRGRVHCVVVPYISSTEAGFKFGIPRLIR